jgi:hypothetical protein
MRPLGNGAKPSSIASLFHSSVLASLMVNDSPAAHTFREKVLAREWRPEAQIVPVLLPRKGVTHQLKSSHKVNAASFINNQWAGGVVNSGGPWTGAFGIWRVPSVSKPTTPQGTEGGWSSSSWVGIDGFITSNDVLQAGIRQNVSSEGTPSYYPWFEWFVSGATSPDYVFEVAIDNIRIEPGDELFCAAYYVITQGVGRQGELMFGNVDRGHYFSIVLANPTGASFTGDTAEWIMEAPDNGEPTSSLPRFSPVIFSTAYSIGPNNATGDPAIGVTTEIAGFGETQTAVTLRPFQVEIDYIGSGWLHNLPSNAQGAVPVSPGTNPTSWYTTPENVQHIAYVGNDARIHELFYRIG